ncbi:MAG: hypothetical protein GY835_13405 [bacterium]|nr:hypothetical protein [bacterium]
MKTLSRLLPIAALLGCISLLAGCYALSINPLYTEGDIIPHGSLNPGLTGIWGDPTGEDPETWQFIEIEENAYRLIIREKRRNLIADPERDGMFIVHLLQLDDRFYLDVYPEEPEGVNENFLAHVIPAHSFLKVKTEGHILSLSLLDGEWLQEGLEQGDLDIDHVEQEEIFVLTATTEDLQRLIRSHADDAFGEWETMTRLQ